MHLDPLLPRLVGLTLVVLTLGLLMRLLRQPYVLGYLLAGVLLGPHGLGAVDDDALMQRLGSIGVVILLFFVGMEVSLPKLVQRWRVALLGTLCQVLGSVAFVAVLGAVSGWPLARIVLLGFVVSLSSTAVVMKLLQDWGELESPVGQDVVSVLLAQDLAVVPMLLTLQLVGGQGVGLGELAVQLVAGLAMVGCLAWLTVKREIRLPLGAALREDPELQVFAATMLCFGLALLSGVLGLSTALGAFLAGVIVSTARETHWVSERLESFRVVFVGLFFFSVGALIDLAFLRANALTLGVLLLGVLVLNTVLNGLIMRGLGRGWRESFYSGALLAQIGEFSFVLAALGFQAGIVADYSYQTTVATIALSLLASPLWIAGFRRLARSTREAGLAPAPAEGPPPAE